MQQVGVVAVGDGVADRNCATVASAWITACRCRPEMATGCNSMRKVRRLGAAFEVPVRDTHAQSFVAIVFADDPVPEIPVRKKQRNSVG